MLLLLLLRGSRIAAGEARKTEGFATDLEGIRAELEGRTRFGGGKRVETARDAAALIAMPKRNSTQSSGFRPPPRVHAS